MLRYLIYVSGILIVCILLAFVGSYGVSAIYAQQEDKNPIVFTTRANVPSESHSYFLQLRFTEDSEIRQWFSGAMPQEGSCYVQRVEKITKPNMTQYGTYVYLNFVAVPCGTP